ncbi:flagellar hook-associated protein FlgL [Desulfoscipio gibsoniae]|uniref:Flagellar hook-associated protein 3 n=1 Tax=Desulfoscipio gibsoniae DSM 7213 TaxID=767817 RepID=R4KMD9_9FIRM|nr:flagellar hook-associated protein FlgL [Desulfoscipio gibsoniae]AGL01700.1 flagellar hook-associated protein 3 [Desulfoscipio gibsoniae DSM 7213]
MRITNIYMANNILNSIQTNLSKLARSQEQMATSRRLLRLSDDPNVMGQFMSIKGNLSYNDQYDRNIQDGLGYLDMNDTVMGTLGDLLSKAQEYALQGSHGTYNADDKGAISEQIDKMIDQAVDLANSTVGGKYIYAGTKNNRPPFERVGDKIIYNGDFNGIYREVLAGTDYRIDAPGVTSGFEIKAINDTAKSSSALVLTQRQDDKNIVGIIKVKFNNLPDPDNDTVSIEKQLELNGIIENNDLIIDYTFENNVLSVTDGKLEGLKITFPTPPDIEDGAEYTITINNSLGVFGRAEIDNIVYDSTNPRADDNPDRGIFDALFALRDRLRDDDTAGLQKSIAELGDKMDMLLQHRVQAGARYRHFESLQNQLLDQEIILKDNLNKIEGADIAELSIEVSQQALSYNASLAVGATIMNISLLNFLK